MGLLVLLAVWYVGFRIIVRPWRRSGQPPALGQSRLGRSVSTFLAFAVVFQFFADAVARRPEDGVTLTVGGLLVLVAVATWPGLEPLVALAGAGVFLINLSASSGPLGPLLFLAGLTVYMAVASAAARIGGQR